MSSTSAQRQVLKFLAGGSAVGVGAVIWQVRAQGWTWSPTVLVYGGALAAFGVASGLALLELRRTALAVLVLWLVLDVAAVTTLSRSVTLSFLGSQGTWIGICIAVVVWWNRRRSRRSIQNRSIQDS